ncbi:MAG: RNA polymerase factor sigma-54 [Deltaproteobacteria bacterium]|nr:RNA polymerase factor sigma-54 [Deltaproteobacteria bacterium]
MVLQIRQQLRQIQQLVMTPQLQQAIKLLQYNHLEMLNALEQELKENPALETASFDDPFSDQDTPGRDDLKSLEDITTESVNPVAEALAADWDNYLENYGGDYSPPTRDYSDRPTFENLISYKNNLFRYLVEQLRLSKIEDEDRRIALEIIGNLSDDGYLEISLQDLSASINTPVGKIESVLKRVQEFEPSGIAARDLRECLLIQVRSLEKPNQLAIRILEEDFDLLQSRKMEILARKFKATLDDTQNAVHLISTLNPKPGQIFGGSDTVYIAPDIFIFRVGNDYSIVLNDDGLPRLRINSLFQKELHGGSSSSSTKDYLQEKMRGAMWLIKSIHQRQRTIYRTTQSILKFQREFFDKGIDYLKPLVLKDVADDIEMHESTISRVTSNKYVHTPRGIFELKFFFNSGIKHGNEEIASESVKNQILRIVRSEDPKTPVSDKQIVEELAKSDITIARRTVAKYREMLGIAPSSKRKKKF